MSEEKLTLKGNPIHVCEKIPIFPGIEIFPRDIKICPYCGEKLRKDETKIDREENTAWNINF